MATKAFVLIETVVGKVKVVVATLGQVEGVKSADPVTGPYDIIAVIEAENLNEMGEIVAEKIAAIAGISRTVTCLAIHLTSTESSGRI